MLATSAWLLAAGWLYGPVIAKLAHDWRADASTSHGFLILPIALALAWRQRDRLRHTVSNPSAAGLLIVGASLALYVAGTLGAELFVTRVSMLGVLAGTIVFVLGWDHFRVVAFPIAFLIFMIPLPAILFDQATVSLQLAASRLGEQMLYGAQIPVLRDGNILKLANATLEVNDACSGIRSLTALVALVVLGGHLFEPSPRRRAIVAATAVPLAVILNGLRIAATGVAAARLGSWAAEGMLHDVLGWVVFVAALATIGLVHWIIGTRHSPRTRVMPGPLEAL